MQPTLSFSTLEIQLGDFGRKSPLPDLLGYFNLQNRTSFRLGETEEVYEGFGQTPLSFPYRQRTGYTRALTPGSVRCAVLENDHLRAVFLPDFGGRLWRLTDKDAGRELLYTNDVLRPSNLAICNAWFSGGVEWNISMIGHSPFTTEPLFVARTRTDTGAPVLRMYEYERKRGVCWQMDFWLEEESRFLCCRMRIENSTPRTLPMYWWSNIAVPEYEGGRLAVSADSAYTYMETAVVKTPVPLENGRDISRYNCIPYPVDYFFDLKDQPRYVASLDAGGYGLLQFSSRRLQGRKLFSWGHSTGSDRWQEFLTETAGPYIEIQAGLGKTQFGCIPMAPHTAWEWIEYYGPVQADPAILKLDYEPFRALFGQLVRPLIHGADPEAQLADTHAMATAPAELVSTASGQGALQRVLRASEEGRPLAEQLDFGSCGEMQRWADFVHTGHLEAPTPDARPGPFVCAADFHARLLAASRREQDANWYVWYHLGLSWAEKEDWERAETALERSMELQPTAWALHALACVRLRDGRPAECAATIRRGMAMRPDDRLYATEGLRTLVLCENWEGVCAEYEALDETGRADARNTLHYINALTQLGRYEPAFALLMQQGGLVPADIREGERSVVDLYEQLAAALGISDPIPHTLDFRMQNLPEEA